MTHPEQQALREEIARTLYAVLPNRERWTEEPIAWEALKLTESKEDWFQFADALLPIITRLRAQDRAEIERLRQYLCTRDTTIEQLDASLAAKDEELAAERRRADEAERKIEDLKDQLGDPDGTVAHAEVITAMADQANARSNTLFRQLATAREALKAARFKLSRYQKCHPEDFIGGLVAEYEATIKVIDAALSAFPPQAEAGSGVVRSPGFTDANGRHATRGDLVEYHDGRRGILGEVYPDGDAEVAGIGTVKWRNLAKVPDRPQSAPAPEAALGGAAVAEGWEPESEAPSGKWLLTYRKGEADTSIASLCIWPDGDREWIAPDGRTTVTHHSYAAPTHFFAPPAPPSTQQEPASLLQEADHGG